MIAAWKMVRRLAAGIVCLSVCAAAGAGQEPAPGPRPTAVLQAPREVPLGQGFRVSGERSSAPPPGRLVRYVWTNPATGQSAETAEPILNVPPDAARRLAPGRHRLQLVVVDDAGNRSEPAEAELIVSPAAGAEPRPAAVPDAPREGPAGQGARPGGERPAAPGPRPTAVLEAPGQVPSGQGFQLNGGRSSAPPPRRIVRYVWTDLGGGAPIETSEPSRALDTDAARRLAAGQHRFTLVVVDDAGNRSEPAEAETIILGQTGRPTAVLDAPRQVVFRQNLRLGGERSFAGPQRRIVKYVWTDAATGVPVETAVPSFAANADPSRPLIPGGYQFTLMVVDDAGNRSDPTTIEVAVLPPRQVPPSMNSGRIGR